MGSVEQGDVDMKSYPITAAMKKLPVDQLFDEMAGKLVDFAAGEMSAAVDYEWMIEHAL